MTRAGMTASPSPGPRPNTPTTTGTGRPPPQNTRRPHRARVIRPRHATTVVLGALTAGLLAACSGGPTATGAPSAPPAATTEPSTATPTATASATPTSVATADAPVPAFPADGNSFARDAALAFSIYYLKVLNHDRTTGDPSLLRSISDPGCSGCDYDANEIDAFRSKGYTSQGLEIQFRSATIDYWNPEEHEVALTVTTHRPPHELVDKAGKVVEHVPAQESGTFRMDLRWQDDRWTVWEVQ